MKNAILIFIVFAITILTSCQQPRQKPNIIYIYTDQQSAGMMSCAGNKWLKTPAMDYIATNGIRFTRAYSTNPVCAPARTSLMTGRFPGEFNDDKGRQIRENIGAINAPKIPEYALNTSLPSFLKKAGYDLVFGGKIHQPKDLDPHNMGFNVITSDERDELAEKTANYIRQKHEKPYFMVVSLINPHDICYMALRDHHNAQKKKPFKNRIETRTLDIAMNKPEGLKDEDFYSNYCPSLPVNYEPQEDEPHAIDSLLKQRPFRYYARETYSDKDWQMHRWAYCRLTEVVDKQIQEILDALRESKQEENTLVLFSSDHGDMNAAHKMEHKTALYEESVNIPFMAMWKGVIAPNQVDKTHLVSNGLDLLPTVCDYAGVNGVSDPRGRSLRPLLEGKKLDWRKTLGVESEIGRMVLSQDGYKYIKYDFVGIEERLHDLNADPGETTHFETDPSYSKQLGQLKKDFDTIWFPGY